MTAVLVATGTRGTVFLAVPAVVIGVGVYTVLRRGPPDAREQPAKRQACGEDDWRGFGLLTSAVIVRSVVFFFGLSSLLALYVGTGLHGGRQAGKRRSRPCLWRAPSAPSQAGGWPTGSAGWR